MKIASSCFAVELLMNHPAAVCLHNVAMILTTHVQFIFQQQDMPWGWQAKCAEECLCDSFTALLEVSRSIVSFWLVVITAFRSWRVFENTYQVLL